MAIFIFIKVSAVVSAICLPIFAVESVKKDENVDKLESKNPANQ
jgi:hypothetical protein